MADLERFNTEALVEPLRGLISVAKGKLDSPNANLRLNRRVVVLKSPDRLYLLTDSRIADPNNLLHIQWIKTGEDISFENRVGSINLPTDEARVGGDFLNALQGVDLEAVMVLRAQIEGGQNVSMKNYSEELKRIMVLDSSKPTEVSPK